MGDGADSTALLQKHFLLRLHQHFQVDIPQADYARLISLDDVLDYLQARLV